MRPAIACAAVSAAILAGCAAGPDYRRPDAGAPASFQGEQPAGDSSLGDLGWWDLYQDPVLTGLVREALVKGLDARIAAARVDQARAVASQVHGERFPGIGYSAGADRGRNSILGNANPSGGGSTSDGFYGYLGAAWEFDLWGRVRRLDEAARDQYLATQQAQRGVRLTLVGAVATSYFDLLELDQELAITEKSAASFSESARLFQRRLEGGLSSQLEIDSAEAARATSASRVPQIQRAIALEEDRLCVLLGRPPGHVERGAPLTAPRATPAVPAGLPSELLERRPDVLEAEFAARAANADIGVTVGGFLPRIGLSAVLGSVSPSLDSITSGRSGLWSIAASATGPVFQGGGLEGQYAQAKAAWEEAKLRYQRAALAAFADTADALATRQRIGEQVAEQEKAAAAYREAAALASRRFEAGKASYLEVLQAEQLLLPAEAALAQGLRDQLLASVRLYMALGGGWRLSDAAWASPR